LQVTEAQVLSSQLEYLIELPRTLDDAERSTILGELESSLLVIAELANRTEASEKEIDGHSRRVHQDRQRAARQLNELMQKNQRMLQRVGAMGIRLRSESQMRRTGVGLHLFTGPAEEFIAGPYGALTACGSSGKPHFFVTHGEDLSIVTQVAPTVPARDVFVPAMLAGLAGCALSFLLAAGRLQPSRWFLILASAGLLWSWKLRPEPFGLALLLAAFALGVLMLIQRIRRGRVSVIHR
jgi:hypothetical protein